jgi:transposase
MDLKLQVLRQEVKQFRDKDQRVWGRLLALIELTKFRHKHVRVKEDDYERIASRFEKSGRTLRRWEALYQRGGAKSLVAGKAPGRTASAIRGHTAKKIREWRKLYNWGAEVIQAHLRKDHGIELSRHKIQRYLRKKGLILRRRKIKPAKKHTRVVKVEHPGAHTQTDVKHLPHLLINRKKCYVYNFVDHASRWSFKKAYDSYGPSETKDFFSCVVKAAPFSISRAQTDNGVEFTNKYISHVDDPKTHALDELCAFHGIRHVLIPPGEKELQGLVERSHRQDDEELYHRIQPKDLEQFNRSLAVHCEWRNSKRRRKALDWKTSNEFLAEYKLKIEKWIYENGESPFALAKTTEGKNNENQSGDLGVKKAA